MESIILLTVITVDFPRFLTYDGQKKITKKKKFLLAEDGSELKLANTCSIVGTTCFHYSLAKEFMVQFFTGFNLQLDGEIHDNFLDESFVAAEPSSFHGAHVGAQPSDEKKFHPFAHFVAALNSDETKRSLVVGELTTELVEIDTHSFIANQIALKLEHGPVVSDSIKIFLKTTVPTSLNMS